ncbi:LOW QUALITY PROTEIN: signal transducer and transcription activator 6-like [Aplochiton taeniatus]
MAQWAQMNELCRYLRTETVTDLYPPHFPIEARCFLANWIEEQSWEDFSPDHVEQEGRALSLLNQIISCLQTVAHQKVNVVDKMRLMHLSVNMSAFRATPLQLVVTVRDILRKERALLSGQAVSPIHHFPSSPSREVVAQGPASSMQDVDHLVLKVLEIQDCRQQIHQLQEELNWERQNFESTQVMVMLVGEPSPELLEKLSLLLQSLIQSTLLVDKQPPQVIKTQSKFSTTVRYLLGEKVASGKPVLLKAQIITETQARSLGQLGNVPSENVGEVINNTAILEHNTSTKSTCATFRNMSIKKIKRADRKGSESVTEEKFALLFSTEITITGCDTPFRIQIISLPVVVIVHGSQDNSAMATIIWDCAFSEPDRILVVAERVPWRKMCLTLNRKFMSEVQTQRSLNVYNQNFLAQKIFDQPDISEDFNNMLVSWAQFNKEVLQGRPFTFWQWFDGVMELTKKHLKPYWSDGLIFGFIGKQHLHLILKDRPNGTFLLRFSDSEIGGITIAYVAASENGGQKIQNIRPFTKRDLEIRCLGDSIRDIELITHVWPDMPKNDRFKKYYTGKSNLIFEWAGTQLRLPHCFKCDTSQ